MMEEDDKHVKIEEVASATWEKKGKVATFRFKFRFSSVRSSAAEPNFTQLPDLPAPLFFFLFFFCKFGFLIPVYIRCYHAALIEQIFLLPLFR